MKRVLGACPVSENLNPSLRFKRLPQSFPYFLEVFFCVLLLYYHIGLRTLSGRDIVPNLMESEVQSVIKVLMKH